ncbi:MAG TPA: O-antigen ligase family protein [Bryobacteraceae bacterium]|nr:O-antigen ligase family protein [Bryobacteraceae bacterium]
MHYALAALFVFAILTLWVPAVWPVTVFQVGIFTLCVVALWRHFPPRLPYPAVPLAAAVFWGSLQLACHLTAYPFATETDILRFASFLATFVTAFCLFQDSSARRWFQSGMLWFAFLVSLVASLAIFTSSGRVFWIFPTDYGNIMGPIVYHNHWAVFVEAVFPIALYQAFRRESDSLLYAGMAAALYASVIASASRTGTILTTAEIVAAALLMAIRGFATGRTVLAAFLRMGILFAAFTAVVGWNRVWERFNLPDPMHGRREFNISSLHIIAAHPLTGSGLGTWPVVYPHYAIIDVGAFANQAHNDWLQFAAEGGIPFALLMFSLFLWCLGPAFRTVWGIGVISVFMHAAVDYPFSRPALGSWTILIVAMLAARQKSPRRSPGGSAP